MKLERIHIHRRRFGKDKDKLSGEVEVKGTHGTIVLKITNETAVEIVKMCADSLIDAAKEVSELMVEDLEK